MFNKDERGGADLMSVIGSLQDWSDPTLSLVSIYFALKANINANCFYYGRDVVLP